MTEIFKGDSGIYKLSEIGVGGSVNICRKCGKFIFICVGMLYNGTKEFMPKGCCMNVEIAVKLRGARLDAWRALLERSGLSVDGAVDRIALVWEGDELIATASRCENLLKYIAVKSNRQGEDLTATVVSALRSDAFEAGYRHLFLYTKPENERVFSSLFFYPVASTDSVLLMESRQGGIADFVASLANGKREGRIGALVMNCNPFTLGHQALIERAARECDHVFVFVLSEDKSRFSAKDRMAMVKLGTAHIPNLSVLPTGPYLISSATFPTYFLKDRDHLTEIQCQLDIEIFARHFAPALSIGVRYVGSEPLSPLTERYNRALARHLPRYGIEFVEVERVSAGDEPISASHVRECIDRGDTDALNALLPQTTIEYLRENHLM